MEPHCAWPGHPGLRYLTVIVCGLLSVPYRRYITAHLAGSSVYIAVLLALGALFGPTILDVIHLPAWPCDCSGCSPWPWESQRSSGGLRRVAAGAPPRPQRRGTYSAPCCW